MTWRDSSSVAPGQARWPWVNKRHVKMFYLSETGIEDITGGSIAPTIEAVMMDNSRYTVSDPFSLYKALGEG